MARKFITAHYDTALDLTVTLRECLPETHLARFIAAVLADLDLSAFYARYGERGGEAFAPELLLGLLLYAYATGVFSSRKIERATYESIPFRFLAGGHHPDHDTLANFRKTFLTEFQEVFVQVLLVAETAGVLKLGNLSLDGTKIHADASKSHAVSYRGLLQLEERLRGEVAELLALSERADRGEALPAELDWAAEVVWRHERLANLAQAKAVLAARAQERDEQEQAEYEAKVRARDDRAAQTGGPARGRAPKPPTPGPRPTDQYNFTDPDSRIMKNSQNAGFDQHYNAAAAVEHTSRLIVAHHLSNHPTDHAEALPTLDAIPPEVGQPQAAAADCGFYSPANIAGMAARGIEPYLAVGREGHRRDWQEYFWPEAPPPPPDEASPVVKMAYKLKTELGRAIYRLRKSTIEPVIGIIKEVLGFRQFSLRGWAAVAGEWGLVCLAYNLKRLHVLLAA